MRLFTNDAAQVDVSARRQQGSALRLQCAAYIVDVVLGLQRQGVSAHLSAHVADVVCADLQRVTPCDGAAVAQVAREVQVHIGTSEQCAAAVQVAGAHAHIHLRHQHALLAAIGQCDLLRDQKACGHLAALGLVRGVADLLAHEDGL